MSVARAWLFLAVLCIAGTASAQQLRPVNPRLTVANPQAPAQVRVTPVAKLPTPQKTAIAQGLLKTTAAIVLSDEISLTVAKPTVPEVGALWLQNTWWVTSVVGTGSLNGYQYLPDGLAAIPNQDDFDKHTALDKHVEVWLTVPVGRQYLVDCRVEKAKTIRVKVEPQGSSPSGLVFENVEHLSFLLDINAPLQRFAITGTEGTANGTWRFFGCEMSWIKK
jgi:hypothetical protein